MITNRHMNLFWARVNILSPDECWEWEGAKDRHGYGKIFWRSMGNLKAHRVAFMLECGGIPEGTIIMHTCDNPSCCNPSHLIAGTLSDNTQDMYNKGRRVQPKGEDHPMAKLTFEKVRKIRDMSALGMNAMQLARLYDVSPTHVRRIVKGERW